MPDVVGVTSRMLIVFAPQVVLYGMSVVLYGLLQAYRRFSGADAGAGDRQPYRHCRLPGLRAAGQGTAAFQPAALGRARPIGRHDAGRSRPGRRSPGSDVAAAPALATDPAVPGRGCAPRERPGDRRRHRTCRLRRVEHRVHHPGQRARDDRRGGGLQLCLAGVQLGVHGAGVSIAISAFPVLSARAGAVFDQTCAGSTRAVVLARGSAPR